MSTSPFHLALALDGAGWHPAAWRESNSRSDELFDAAYWVDLVRTARAGSLDFVTLEDSLTLQSDDLLAPDDRTDRVRGRLDALLVASRVAPVVDSIGLIPVVTTTHTEPFHVAKALATLDFTSSGRAGWQARVGGLGVEAELFGRRPTPDLDLQEILAGQLPADAAALFDEAGEVLDVVRRLWDSWEDGAEIRDVENRRFIDRSKVHHINYRGSAFSVRGPLTTPRPPQGQPVVSVLAHQRIPYELAARHADLVFVTPTGDDRATAILADLDAAVAAVDRAGETLQSWADVVVLLDRPGESGASRLDRLNELAGKDLRSDTLVFAGSAAQLADLLVSWHRLGYHGFRLRPGVAVDDTAAIVGDLVPLLQQRGLVRTGYPATTLRGLLGLPTTVPNRYAAARHAG